MRIMKHGLKVPILCRSRFHNRIYSLPGAKICYTDPQHDIWLLLRIWDHLIPWNSFLFRGRFVLGLCNASTLLIINLISNYQTEFWFDLLFSNLLQHNIRPPSRNWPAHPDDPRGLEWPQVLNSLSVCPFSACLFVLIKFSNSSSTQYKAAVT